MSDEQLLDLLLVRRVGCADACRGSRTHELARRVAQNRHERVERVQGQLRVEHQVVQQLVLVQRVDGRFLLHGGLVFGGILRSCSGFLVCNQNTGVVYLT